MDTGEDDKQNMVSSYPDPSNQSAGVHPHPFYSEQPQQPRDGSVAHAPTAPMQANNRDMKGFTPEYMRASYLPPSTPQELAQQGLSVNQTTSEESQDQSKKKQKVSRACDECRRKKIKCDAESEEPGVRCSACTRSDNACQFSRQPQKRGPSKGYIKELAERVVSLERASGTNPYTPSAHGLPMTDFNAYSPTPDFMGTDTRKRTHSMVEGAQGFGTGAEQLQSYAKGYTPSMSSVAQDGAFYRGTFDPSQGLAGDLGSLGGEPIDDYYREMHTYLPILANSKEQVHLMLNHVRAPLKDVLLQAIAAAMNTSRASVDYRYVDSLAAQLSRIQIEDAKVRSVQENITFLQALLFIIIAQETSGPGKNDPVLWYGVASGLASFLKLHLNKEATPNDSPDDAEIKTQGRRAYLILAMLDRWHAASMAVPTIIPDEKVSLLPSDLPLLGESAYHLIRISLCLGHISSILTHKQTNLHPPSLLLEQVLRGELSRFREGIERSFPLLRHVHLAYLHVKLLLDRHLELKTNNTREIMIGAFKTINLLSTDQNRASPLTHHFAALAAITLAEVRDHDADPISDALKLLQSHLVNGSAQYPYGVANARPAWSNAISAFIGTKVVESASDRGGLQHLADAAVGADGGVEGEEVGKKLEGVRLDWSIMTAEGYLRMFE